jgi:hypothetical protein
MTIPRTQSPPKEFDDRLENLVALVIKQGVTISGLELTQNQKDVVEQRRERAERDALETEFKRTHARFTLAQAGRYRRYLQLLSAVRGIYRDDTEMTAALAQFRRRRTRRSANTEPPPPAKVSA